MGLFGSKSIASKSYQTDFNPQLSDARTMAQMEDVRANNRPRRGLFGGYPVLTHILGGSDAVAAQRQREQEEALRPFAEAKMAFEMEQLARQREAYDLLRSIDASPEERIAAAFAPKSLGENFASGSGAYTLGRNDVRGFRNRPVMVNDAPPDPQVVSGRLVAGDGTVIYEPPQYESVGENSRLVQLSPGVQGGGGGGFDAFYNNFLAPQEGGFAADDGNGAPVNFGINQGANPDVDVRNLTQDQAKQLLHDRYWAASGADRLPGGLAEIHGDTAVNMGVGAAQQLLEQSGGDANRYLQLREQRYRSIAQADPSKARFLPTWLRRNQQLAQYVGGGQPAQQGGPRVVVDAAQRGPEWQTVPADEARALGPGQFQRNARTGEVKQITGTAPRSGQALAPQDRTFISEQRESAKQLQATIPLVDRFLQLNREVGTGAILSNSAVAGVGAAFNPKLAEMKSIQDRLTPAMRQGMPGAASDRDVAMFRSATVGIDKPGNANAAVGKALKASATRQSDYVAFLEHYAQTNGSLLGAQEEWDAYAAANPMFDQDAKGALTVRRTTPWRQFFGVEQPKARTSQPSQLPQRAPSAPKVGEVRKGYRFKGGDPSSPSSWVKVQ